MSETNEQAKQIEPYTPAPSVPRDRVHAVTEGVGVRRQMLFQAPISRDGWHGEMLNHIRVAKVLGFTMFEIDITGLYPATPREKKEKASGADMYSMFFRTYVTQVEGDEWKVVQSDASAEEGKKAPKLVPVVTVWTLVVDDA